MASTESDPGPPQRLCPSQPAAAPATRLAVIHNARVRPRIRGRGTVRACGSPAERAKATRSSRWLTRASAQCRQPARWRASAARGRVIVTLDADLQNDPADIPALLAELERSGAAAVAGYRVDRRDSGWKRVQSRIANGVRNRLNRETVRDTGCSLKAFRAEALRTLPMFNGMHRFLPTLIRMQGGRVTELPVHHRPRRFGKTKYGMWNRVFRALVDALAVRWMQRRALRYCVREELP